MDYKVIDIETKGNAIRVYLGDKDCTDYHGDDWNDRGVDDPVYSNYVKAYIDMAVPFSANVAVCEYYLSKDTFKQGRIPYVMIDYTSDSYRSYDTMLGEENAEGIYFEMSEQQVLDIAKRLGVLTSFVKVE